MDLKEKLNTDLQANESKFEYSIFLKKSEIIQKSIINKSNINLSNESIKTTEYSSESGELISKYLTNNSKNKSKMDKKDNLKYNKNKNIHFEMNIQQNNNKNSKKCKIKSKKAPKFMEYKSDYLTDKNTNINAPNIPFIYNNNFYLNNLTNQVEIGEKEYIENLLVINYNKYQDYKNVFSIPHDKLSHLCVNENLYINKEEKTFNKISITQRNKHKFITLIYITPKKNI